MKAKCSIEIKKKLFDELYKAGLPRMFSKGDGKELSPLDIFVSGGVSVKPYVDIVLKFAPYLELDDKLWIARVLSEKGLNIAVPFLLSLFQEFDEKRDFWAVGNALTIIDDKSSYNKIIEICREKKYGISRQMLIWILPKVKTKEAYEILISCLDDHTVRGHAIDALGRFGDISAVPILESLVVKKGLYEYKAKNTALKRLYKISEKVSHP